MDVRLEATIRARNNHLFEARVSLGLSQAAAARLAGIHSVDWNLFELMKKWPSRRSQEKIATALGKCADELFPTQLAESGGFHLSKSAVIDAMEFAEFRERAGEDIPVLPDTGSVELLELREHLSDEIARLLTPKQAETVRMYFGLDGKGPASTNAVARELGMSTQGVVLRLGKAMERLRKSPLLREHCEINP